MKCTDCLHYDVCKDDLPDSILNKEMTEDCHCRYFKDKSKFIELPCKAGEYVWVVDNATFFDLFRCRVIEFHYFGDELFIDADDDDNEIPFELKASQFNEYWFFDKSKAEAKLKELNEND